MSRRRLSPDLDRAAGELAGAALICTAASPFFAARTFARSLGAATRAWPRFTADVRHDVARLRAGDSPLDVLRNVPSARDAHAAEQAQARATISARRGQVTGARRSQPR